mmetsp:Transcript_10437/g.16314  ORF Transcript_10437/g.16314 Transcript_10437/m.16314 type:complete len:201 (+) Transcript_10437:303-905(+)|eukprot:CAMPEP_0184329610 /NCGR_PEP_ID=MMETSP1049-20130417/144244_1 /TAXON_ID=77928 /ORGANISM="Proteomonas sulcata, Strain CCMP704" /LENGTH=200 /DNA_ID=CAMNT_0026651993 /DNA_START=738 /DNA_END=1340 /DNA_ORIENTATION=-
MYEFQQQSRQAHKQWRGGHTWEQYTWTFRSQSHHQQNEYLRREWAWSQERRKQQRQKEQHPQWWRESCPFHQNSKVDCGFPGIKREECEKRGCCFDDTSPNKWCYPRASVEQWEQIKRKEWDEESRLREEQEKIKRAEARRKAEEEKLAKESAAAADREAENERLAAKRDAEEIEKNKAKQQIDQKLQAWKQKKQQTSKT